MLKLLKPGAIATAVTIVALTAAPGGSFAGPVPFAAKGSVTAPSGVEDAHYWRHHHHYHHHHWRHRYYYHHWRHRHYGYYYPYYYNPAGAVAGAMVGLATAPLWGWGYPYYGSPYWW